VKEEESTTAVVGTCGGAGTTRLVVEAAATLARDGRRVAVVDAAVATQGLAGYVPGRVEPDLTRVLLAEDLGLEDALTPLGLDVPGSVSVAPVRAPLERFARAQTAGAARAFEQLLAGAAGRFGHVLVDVPPVATNLGVAAATGADRVAVVAPPGERGTDAVQRVRGRLADVGAPAPVVVLNEGADGADPGGDDGLDPDATVPAADERDPAAPAVVEPDPSFAPAVAEATAAATGANLELSFPDAGALSGVL
jgi:septum site-determining protein MinD